MGEENQDEQKIPEGVSMGGSDLFSNFMGLFFDPVMSFCEGAGIGNIKIERTKWSDMQDAYKKSNGWYGYNMKVDWQPEYPKKPEIPERPPKKPTGVGPYLLNSYLFGQIGKKSLENTPLENYKTKRFEDNYAKLFGKLSEDEKESVEKYRQKIDEYN